MINHSDALVESADSPFDIDLVGFFSAGLGLGETARGIHRSLVDAGFKVRTIKQNLPQRSEVEFVSHYEDIDPVPEYPAPVCICSLNGEHLPILARSVGDDFFKDRKIVGIWFWETPNPPETVRSGLAYVDEIWTCSEFTADAIRTIAGEIPVKTFPHPIFTSIAAANSSETEPVTPSDRYTFLFSFDFNSCVQRKNPNAVCAAFAEAFPNPSHDGPVCIIKSINADKHRLSHYHLMSSWAHRPDIQFIDGFLPISERDALVARANCYVSLHRAEGLGITLLEAMAAGKPSIATGYSGNLEFMNEQNSLLVPYNLIEVKSGSLHYYDGDEWAEPDISAAAEAMRRCEANGDDIIELARRGQQEVLANHSIAKTGATLRQLVQEVLSTPLQAKNISSHDHFRDAARKGINSLREIESKLLKEQHKSSWISRKNIHPEVLRKSVQKTRKSLEMTFKSSQQESKLLRLKVNELERQLSTLRHQVEELITKNRPERKELDH